MPAVYRAVAPIVLATLIFQLGNGLMSTLLSLRLDLAGFSTQIAGLVSAAYYAGLLLGTVLSRPLIARIGHIRAFAAFAAVAAATMLLHALVLDAVVWCVLRGIAGYAIAALFLVMESWLNIASGNEIRGRVFSLYMVANYAAIGFGQLFLWGFGARGFEAFSIAALMVTLALVPICVTRQAAPAQEQRSALTFRALTATSPVGIVGCLASGAMLGPLYALLPIYGSQAGLSVSEVSVLMAAVIFGGFLLAWPIGRLSDRVDRRHVLAAVCVGSAAVTLALAATGGRLEVMLPLGALYGGVAFAIYPICVAHTNDFLPPEDAVAATAGLLLAFGIGAMLGPIVAAGLMDAGDRNALFYYSAVCATGLGLFAVWRIRVRAPAPVEEKTVFVPMATTTPGPVDLDPWSEAASERAPADPAG